jgi:hypothetical protein
MGHGITYVEESFVFKTGLKRLTYGLMAVGGLFLVIGIVSSLNNPVWASRLWADILINNQFFLGIALLSVFFYAAHTIGYGGWQMAIVRIPQALGMWIPFAGAIMLIVVVGNWGHWHHLYHWADPAVTDPASGHYDKLIDGKSGFLNNPFWTLRYVLYFGIWGFFAWTLRKLSMQQDLSASMSTYKREKMLSAIFLILFAVSSSTQSWDFIMSIDTHWYSTLFGWYNFATMFVSALAVMILLTILLKRQGYLKNVTADHLHDLGKFMFGFSIFWTYLWFSQYMLIWYANIGEETGYFNTRIYEGQFKYLFWLMLFINFFLPFFGLMSYKPKRKFGGRMVWIAVIILFGHWLDFFLMITPGASKMVVDGHVHYPYTLGIFEIGFLCGFLGLFLYVFFTWISKGSLVPKNHPFFKESLVHHV